ncbi:dnaJ-like protein MG002 homolog [Hylaeus volcanicus]|uniref:dnaJ-like protein MG002 homolog n=1 Tax=Hylaeus volcanicus TaxID=313075 RepID=UPI0023B814C8|nr:dnaJ-like protein MG002 homolog [Hylaeus volcanicus]
MAHIFRMYKSEMSIIVRNYGNYKVSQRSQRNHYEILRISENATQKQIRAAYIKLSKEMHPDVGNKGSHNDFVKINEAYSTLSKTEDRMQYDMNLRYNNTSHNQNSSNRYNYYHNMGVEFKPGDTPRETRRANSIPMSRKTIRNIIIFFVINVLLAVTSQILIAVSAREDMRRRSKLYEIEYQQMKENATKNTLLEQMDYLYELQKHYNFDVNDE